MTDLQFFLFHRLPCSWLNTKRHLHDLLKVVDQQGLWCLPFLNVWSPWHYIARKTLH